MMHVINHENVTGTVAGIVIKKCSATGKKMGRKKKGERLLTDSVRLSAELVQDVRKEREQDEINGLKIRGYDEIFHGWREESQAFRRLVAGRNPEKVLAADNILIALGAALNNPGKDSSINAICMLLGIDRKLVELAAITPEHLSRK